MNISSRLAWTSAFFIAVALFYAPLAYGCVRPDMLPTLYLLSLVVIATGALSLTLGKNWDGIPVLVRLCALALLAQGWLMVWAPIYPEVVAEKRQALNTTMAHIYRLSFDSMVLTTLLLGVFVIACGLFRDALIRRFVLMSATASGILVCVVGVVLKTVGAPLMPYIWKPVDIYWNDFAFFRYHGNAGAFLNLVWPLILVFTRRAFAPRGGGFRKIFWAIASLTCAAALFLNASKAALIIGLLIMPWPFMTWLQRLKVSTLLFLVGVALLGVAAGLITSAKVARAAAFERLSNTHELSGSLQGRVDSYNDDLTALPDAGLLGFGPGLFQVAFPYQLSPMRNVGLPMRDYAHEDYLQTVIEWGWVGTVGWSVLVFGGLFTGFQTYLQRSYFTSKTERHLLLAAILGVLGTLAQALVDFPLQIASLRLFFLLLLAICWASPCFLVRPKNRSSRKRFRLPIPAEYAEKAYANS